MGSRNGSPRRATVAPKVVFFSGVLVPLLVAGTLAAQEEGSEAPPSLEFAFSNPGARSMGLGGAFVALADDATAAFANPAGLVQLLRPEISVELRRRDFSTPYTAGGRALGAPTGYGIDIFDSIRTEHSNETTSGVSYLSFVYPSPRWSIAVYRHQLAEFVVRTELDGLFGDVPEGGVRRHPDQRSTTDLDVVDTGLTGAFKVSDRLSVGLGLSYFSGRIEYRGAIYGVDVYPDTFFEPNSFLPERIFANSSFDVDSTDVGFSAGVLWKITERWRMGAVFRDGPRFEYELFNRAGPASDLPEGTILGEVTDRSIVLPDVWGLGFAYRSPDGSVTVGCEWDRVEYSVIPKSLESPLAEVEDVTVDDANELHLGVEYVFLESSPVFALRAGLWHDPAHRFSYTGADPFARALFQPGEDFLHFSFGAGIAFRRFQIDVGADLSDEVDQYAVSAIFSF